MKQFETLDPAETYLSTPLLFDVALKIYITSTFNGNLFITESSAIDLARKFILAYNESGGRSNIDIVADASLDLPTRHRHFKNDP